MNQPTRKSAFVALVGLALGAPLAIHAADKPAAKGAMADHSVYSDRMQMKNLTAERDALRAAMPAGQEADFYRSKLTSMGYQITAINDAEPDYVEYEAVKGRNSVEVQIDRDASSGVASKVEIEPNIWRADSTKAALRGKTFKPVTTAEFSDRKLVDGYATEQETLRKALPAGHDKAWYMAKLKELGYTVTSTNEADADELEVEVVKGNNTYEVQLDMDGARAKDVDVTMNLWETEATERALSRHN